MQFLFQTAISAEPVFSLNAITVNCNKSAYYYDLLRSCDTEDWSNDVENTEINYSLKYIKIQNHNFT